ncbi:hypothetical protein [Paracoccus sp. SM22M-07]|uniref:hypothetical protein n=1 Tax=Paracoccus sp. SM22M-07 TaxID=1520813 RepID=UPI000923EE7A|nr:hypothetical protein [Paracoccus sp. SM22M-07]OJH45179.1 hypothetical protein IE00_05835 [Paracoccus sp. SM22M-07]
MGYLLVPAENADDDLTGAKFAPNAGRGSVISGLYNQTAYRLFATREGPQVTPIGPDNGSPYPRAAPWVDFVKPDITAPAEVTMPSGQNVVWIPLTAVGLIEATVLVRCIRASNITGGVNVGNSTAQKAFLTNDVFRWSPGDDPTHYVRLQFPNAAYAAGPGCKISFETFGGQKQFIDVVVNFADGVSMPPRPTQNHRAARVLDLTSATRANVFDPATVTWSDSGFDANGNPCWRSRLSHGYSQVGNGETGLYMSEEKFPEHAQNPISYDATEDAIRLHTVAFPMDARPEFQSVLYRHQAAMIQGQTIDEVCGSDGVWRAVVKSSRRRYAWPAFWMVGRGSNGAAGGQTQWPPEIDIFEHFNQTFGSTTPITGFQTSASQHYGNAGSNAREGSYGHYPDVDWLFGTTVPIHEGYHSYACAVVWDGDDAWLTQFFDDVEISTVKLLARHQDNKTRLPYYPMMNVAVRAPDAYTPEQYNTDDGRGFDGDMCIRDMGYYPAGFSF